MNNKKENISVWIIEDNEDFRISLVSLINSLPDFICGKSFESCEEAIDSLKDLYRRILFYPISNYRVFPALRV